MRLASCVWVVLSKSSSVPELVHVSTVWRADTIHRVVPLPACVQV